MVFIPEETELTIQENAIPIFSTQVRAGLLYLPSFHFKRSQVPCLGNLGAITQVVLLQYSLEIPHHPGMLQFRSAVGVSCGCGEEHARRRNGY